jgi:putative hydrolase of the HAD superfamily
MKNTILFDLGGTLAQYYDRSEFPGILDQAITEVQDYLRGENILDVSPESIRRRAKEEDYEARDYSVRPLEGRLARIFQIDDRARSDELVMALCRCFMRPIFARGRCYEDALPVLRELRSRSFRSAIISNTPWGSPASLWREEVERLGLSKCVDAVVFCRDAGWRKPAGQIFKFALEELQASPQDCIFVGDDPRWDLVGPRGVGIEAILTDRRGTMQDAGEKSIESLYELLERWA